MNEVNDRFVILEDTVSGYWYYDTEEDEYVYVPSAKNLE